MAVERKSAIRKAPAADVVDVLTARDHGNAVNHSEPVVAQAVEPIENDGGSAAVRRPGPGRPRSKRRMEPFSSKMEIDLRDEMDDFVTKHGLSIVDFLDEAVRDRLKK